MDTICRRTSPTGVLADGSPAPPLPPLPPPPVLSAHHDQRQHPPRVSRYRSLRGKSISSPDRNKTFDVFCDNDDDNNTSNVSRNTAQGSPTRRRSVSAASKRGYHAAKEFVNRKRQQTTTFKIPAPAPAPTKSLPLNPKSVNLPSPVSSTARTNHKSLRGSRSLNFARFKETSPPSPPRTPPLCPAPSTPPNIRQEYEAFARPSFVRPVEADDGARQRQGQSEAKRCAAEVARLEAETDRILAEQKKLDLARLQAQLAATASSQPEPKPKKSKLRPPRLILDKLSFFTRRNKPNAQGQPSTPKSAPADVNTNWTPSPSPTVVDENRLSQIMNLREHGGVDAPASASNGGERRVTVRCLSSTINLPVTPDTSPVDIAQGAANLTSHKINPATSIVMECYEQRGLERRLRRYESIRDVINSWDRDQRNSLLVMSHESASETKDLELASVPKSNELPIGFTVQLYHAARPGKWNKRWITLMESGQIFAAKRPDAKSTDKNSTVLCHLSDFDIFTPAQAEVKQGLKAPKKFCFVVKSQQKSSLFPTGENFMHYFSTEDEALAQRFHELVFGWRSWYLATKRLDTESPKAPISVRRSATSGQNSPSLSRYRSYKERPSGGRISSTVGEFEPLIDVPRSNRPADGVGRHTSVRARNSIDGASKPKSWAPPPPLPQSAQGGSEFLAGGLLGDAYDKRRRAETSPTEVKRVEGPFIEGPSLLNNLPKSPTSPTQMGAAPNSWFPSAVEHSARARSQSRPSQYRSFTADAAQSRRDNVYASTNAHGESLRSRPSQRQGVGRGVKPPAGAPLIDFATGGTTSSQPLPTRSSSRTNASATGGPIPGRTRSHSTATTRAGGHRYVSADQPPVPPLPFRSARRPSSGHAHQEPLINRAK